MILIFVLIIFFCSCGSAIYANAIGVIPGTFNYRMIQEKRKIEHSLEMDRLRFQRARIQVRENELLDRMQSEQTDKMLALTSGKEA